MKDVAEVDFESLPRLGPRPAESNKGTFGKVLIVAGSRGMTGAAILAGSAALRSGAGLVRVATPASVLATVAGGNPCYTTVPLAEDRNGRVHHRALSQLMAAAGDNDVLAAGPGLGRSASLQLLLRHFVRSARRPLVLDADGINAFAGRPEWLRDAGSQLILTPHPGELARLMGSSVKEVQANRLAAATGVALRSGAIVVLKGHGTIVTDGKRFYCNATGNPGLATGGTGDVLTGVIVALCGQGLAPFDAACLGVYVHGLAGDKCRDRLGEEAMTAADLLDALPEALADIRRH